MALADRWNDLRTGFQRTFWIANTLELFERFAFYGSKAVLAVYLAEKVGLGPQVAGTLVGTFSGVLYFLPILAGTLVDRYGFRRTLACCFAIFTAGYFLIGLAGLQFGQKITEAVGRTPYMVTVLLLTAIGGSLIKPCIVGTVANTSTEQTRSLGYSIYYTLVNIGGALGPVLALQVREGLGIEYVLIMSSVTSFALFIGTLLFFHEPPQKAPRVARTMGAILKDMVLVFGNIRFMLFLTIASGFYILFWQIFYSFPFYVREVLHFERFELLETVDAWTIIVLTVPATAMVKKWKPIHAVTLGFLIASLAWLLIPMAPSVGMSIVAMALFAAGEATFAPRFYEYVASLAPPEQLGTFMGFAFLPVSIGSFVAGPLAGWLVTHYVRGGRPDMLWYVLAGIGLTSTLAMVLYNAAFGKKGGRVAEDKTAMKMARVILFTGQIEAMSRFYGEVLGLKQVTDEKGWKEFAAGGVTIALHSGPASPGRKGPKIVFHSADVASLRERLVSRGARLGKVRGGEFCLCDGKDPDGNPIQLSNR